MKKVFILAITCIISGVDIFAQDCPICGDWHGVYNDVYLDANTDKPKDGNIKIHLRIRKNGDGYIVRKKRELPDGRILYDDFEDYTFTQKENDPNFLGWHESNPEVEYKDKMDDGRYFYRYEYVLRNNVYAEGNKMKHNWWLAIDEYRRLGPYSPDFHFGDFCDFPVETERRFLRTVTLYKDDDW